MHLLERLRPSRAALTATALVLSGVATTAPATSQSPSPLPAPAASQPATCRPPQPRPPGADQAWCDSIAAGNAGIAAICMARPWRKVTFTADMVPIGTPVPLRLDITPNGVKAGVGFVGFTVGDVVVNGEVVITKDFMVTGHYVAGGITDTAAGATCPPISIAIDTNVLMVKPGLSLPPGVQLANFVQRVPLSFANPKTGGSPIMVVPFAICAAREVNAVAYVTGPPTAPAPPGMPPR